MEHEGPLKIALVSDTHGYLDERVAEVVADCAVAVHAGDVGSAAVLEALEEACETVVAVRGNNDVARKWPAADVGRLDVLPTLARIVIPGGKLVVVHGDGFPARNRHKRLRGGFPDDQVIVYGHSHRMICDTDTEPWVLNPGAAGRVRTYGGGPCCLILSATGQDWQIEQRRFPRQKRRRRGHAGQAPAE
jgi:putative phosphoesterase